MSVEDDNKALVCRWNDLVNRNDLPTPKNSPLLWRPASSIIDLECLT
jgi:hypothetical protein